MRSTFKTLFYINRKKIKSDGNTTILCRITIDGKSTAITTGEECQPSEWNTKQGLTTNRKTNQRINEFRELIEKTYRDILTREGVVSVELIKNRLHGIATNPTTLLTMSKVELQAVKESVGKSRTEGTYLNLSYSDRNLREFVEDKGVQDILISTITEDLFEEYRFFLKKRGLKGTTINNNLCWLSRLMFRAVSRRIIRCNPFENAKYEKEEKKIRFLQKSDVIHLTVKEKGDSLVFQPHCSRSVMGKNLSIVGKACGIRQRLSYHVARHTFGTMSLSAGIPIESIAKMMGHASISSTQIYAQVTDNKISEDMDRLIAKQSAKDKETMEREAFELLDTSICKMEETA